MARQLIPYGLSLILLQSQNVDWLSVENLKCFVSVALRLRKVCCTSMVTYSTQQPTDNSAVIFKFNIYDIYYIYSVVRCMKHAEPFSDV